MRKSVVQDFRFVKESGGIHEYIYERNGLRVLLHPDHTTPSATFMVTYLVGGRHEAPGHTGATHFLEHLLFKGSKRFNKANGKLLDHVMERRGAVVNATTWFDRTNYFELLPRQHLSEAIALEADRMRHAIFTAADRDTEMAVVRNELELLENDPVEALDKYVWVTAFQVHPYRYATIGLREDIETVTVERLREFYDTFYWPGNAVVIIAGDFSTREVLGEIRMHFGKIPPASKSFSVRVPVEPLQEGPRRGVLSRAGSLPVIQIAHRVPRALHKDSNALQVLSYLLSGGHASRLERALVDRRLALRVTTTHHLLYDESLFSTVAVCAPGRRPEEVEKAILTEYEKLKQSAPMSAEISRAKALLETATAFSRDGSLGIACGLTEALALGDWTFYTRFTRDIGAVMGRDVMRAARMWLTEDRSTTAYFIPKLQHEKTK